MDSIRERTRSCGRISEHLWDTYEIECEAGRGMYGVVYKGFHRQHNRYYAIKKFKTTSNPSKESDGISISVCREILLLRELNHPNVVWLEEIVLHPSESTLSLVFEYAEYDLQSIVMYHMKTKRPISEFAIKSFIWQTLNGIHYLHSNWVLHRDLKPANILVMGEGEDEGRIKIADFGLARIFHSPLRPLSDNGDVVTIWYRSPELLLRSKHYTRAIDMWAVGCIFGELFLNQALFIGKDPESQLRAIFNILGTPKVKDWPGAVDMPDWPLVAAMEHYPCTFDRLKWRQNPSREALNLMKRMLEYDPAKRITAAEALDHPYFQELPGPSSNAFDEFKASSMGIPYPKRVKPQDAPTPVQSAAIVSQPSMPSAATQTRKRAAPSGHEYV